MSSDWPTLTTMALFSILREALELGSQIVGADGQRRQPIDAFSVSDACAYEPGLRYVP